MIQQKLAALAYGAAFDVLGAAAKPNTCAKNMAWRPGGKSVWRWFVRDAHA